MGSDNAALVRAFWEAVGEAEFDRAAAMMAPTVTVDWPLSNERIASREHWREVHLHDPGRWRTEVLDLLVDADRVVTRTRVSSGGICDFALSWFTIEQGWITHLEEYRPESDAAPAWRAPWTVAIRHNRAE